jgi:hypothetical protein
MKRVIFIFLILIISSICLTACSENPYIGKYESSNNTILELSANNDCTIINNVYKEAFYTNGKYVIKDNKINITFENNEQNYYGVSSLNGEFEGSKIKISNSLDNKDYIYSKK